MAIETRLAKASLTITEMRDPQNLNHPTDVAAMSKDAHPFLADRLRRSGSRAHPPAKPMTWSRSSLPNSTRFVADTPLDQIRTYLRWHLLHAYAGTSMPEAFETESWNFYAHILNGAEKQQERWKRCTSRVDREMGEALGQVYVAKYFPPLKNSTLSR